jgi:hypothetical protein
MEIRMTQDRATSAGQLAFYLVFAVWLVGALGLLVHAQERDRLETPAVHSSRFVLDALLMPALDADAVPFRWVDPVAAMSCGPGTSVLVNRQPLRAGALVPDTPFELDWRADGCRPFGAAGARFDGRVRLTVFREDWGFSAMVEPTGMRIASPGEKPALLQRGGASLAYSAEHAVHGELVEGIAERTRVRSQVF